jgi:hypothetical protein
MGIARVFVTQEKVREESELAAATAAAAAAAAVLVQAVVYVFNFMAQRGCFYMLWI